MHASFWGWSMRTFAFVGAAFFGFVVAGCASGAPAASSLPLSSPLSIASTAASAKGSVTFTIAGGFAGPTPLSMAMSDATLQLTSTGARAELESLVVPLADLDISAAALPPNGLSLRKLSLHVDRAAATVLSADEDSLSLRAEAPLVLHWSLVLDDGSLYALAPTPTDALPITVAVSRKGDGLAVTLEATCHGTCWSDPGVAALSDGDVKLQADATLVE
jgi:hypothetical protein